MFKNFRWLFAATLYLLLSAPGFAQDTGGARGSAVEIADEAASPRLERVRTLIRANVLGLAQRILEQQGPPALPTGEWLNWERQLWALYASQGKWRPLIDRIQTIPPAFPVQVKQEADSVAVEAWIALGEGTKARQLLRRQLVAKDTVERAKRKLRRQVIESWIADGRLEEAQSAAASFQADYRAQDDDWLRLSAEIALAAGDADQAVTLLAPLDSPDMRVLRLYARLRNNSLDPGQVLEQGEALLAQEGFADFQRPLLAIAIGAARSTRATRQEVDLLERYLLSPLSAGRIRPGTIPDYGVEALVNAYRKLGGEAANDAGYLGGEENGWHVLAASLPAESALVARSLWVTIALSASNEDARNHATNGYVRSLIEAERPSLVRQVFGDDTRLGQLRLDPATGLALSNAAIAVGNMQLAADANATMSEAPPGMARADWLLQSGRVAIIAGRHAAGAERLDDWLKSTTRLTPEQTDAVLQPIFDLQTVDQHRLAIDLLEQVDARAPGGSYPREIAFWLAESYSATRQHVKAADFFLFSALQKDNGFDQWGESARYRAADALLEGNFFDDARTLFEDLLARATEEPRRQSLQRKLQDLRLRESSLKGKGVRDS